MKQYYSLMLLKRFRIAVLMLLSMLPLPMAAQEYGWIPAKDAAMVTDLCGLFSDSLRMALDSHLMQFEDSTTVQIMVLVTPSLGGDEISHFTQKVFEEWGVGHKEKDNGVLIVLKPKDSTDGQVRIGVGYGLEGVLPDAFCKSIIEENMVPHFKEDDYAGGVLEAISVIEQVCMGEYSYEDRKAGKSAGGWNALLVLGGLYVLYRLAFKGGKNRSVSLGSTSGAGSSGGSYRSSSSSSSGSSGSAGRSGGGGHSGGGGASGRW